MAARATFLRTCDRLRGVKVEHPPSFAFKQLTGVEHLAFSVVWVASLRVAINNGKEMEKLVVTDQYWDEGEKRPMFQV